MKSVSTSAPPRVDGKSGEVFFFFFFFSVHQTFLELHSKNSAATFLRNNLKLPFHSHFSGSRSYFRCLPETIYVLYSNCAIKLLLPLQMGFVLKLFMTVTFVCLGESFTAAGLEKKTSLTHLSLDQIIIHTKKMLISSQMSEMTSLKVLFYINNPKIFRLRGNIHV